MGWRGCGYGAMDCGSVVIKLTTSIIVVNPSLSNWIYLSKIFSNKIFQLSITVYVYIYILISSTVHVSRLIIALWRHTLDQHHTGLRQVEAG